MKPVELARRALVILILCLMAIQLGFRVRLITDHRVDLGAQEINVVYGIQKIMLGRPLYEDPEAPPFDVMQYTPAYYFLCAGTGSVVGIEVNDTYALFLLSRIISLLLTLTTCWLIYLLCRSLGADAWMGVAAAALVFALHSEQFYSRIDSLYALFFAAALLVFVRSLRILPAEGLAGDGKKWFVCALLCALAFLTKQTGVLIIGIIGLHLAIERSWRMLGRFTIACALLIAAGLGLLLMDSAPEDLWKNTVQGLMNGLAERPFHHYRDPGVYKFYVGWHLAAVALMWLFLRTGNAVFRFLAVAMILSLLFGVAGSFKQGSGSHYLFEFHLFVVVSCVAWLGSRSEPASRLAPILFLTYGLLFMVHRTRQIQAWTGDEAERSASNRAHVADLRTFNVLVNDLGLQPDDRVYVTYRGHLELLLNGQGLLAQKDIIEWSTTPPFDLRAFEQAMSDGTVRYVISENVTDSVRIMGRSYPLFRPIRECEGRIIWSNR